jgi:hypothetical protein
MAERPLSRICRSGNGAGDAGLDLHRASGDGLALVGLPVLLWWLSASRAGQAAYESFAWYATTIPGYVVLVGLSWAFFNHFCSGVRHFVLDIGAGLRCGHQQPLVGDNHRRRGRAHRGLLGRALAGLRTDMGQGTALGRVRGLGSAHHGSHHWLLQRFTAAGNLLTVGYLVFSLVLLGDFSYESVHLWLGQPLPALAIGADVVSCSGTRGSGCRCCRGLRARRARLRGDPAAQPAAFAGAAFGLFVFVPRDRRQRRTRRRQADARRCRR